MKKIFLLISLLITIVLTGCDPSPYYFSKNEYIHKIERIELVKYRNESYKIVDPSKVTLKFEHEKVEKIETLEYEKIEDFLNDFEKIVFHIENESVNEPTGYCLLWYLKNGNFIVFSCTIKGDRAYSMASEFDATDKFLRHYAGFASEPHYVDILRKYFSNYNTE